MYNLYIYFVRKRVGPVIHSGPKHCSESLLVLTAQQSQMGMLVQCEAQQCGTNGKIGADAGTTTRSCAVKYRGGGFTSRSEEFLAIQQELIHGSTVPPRYVNNVKGMCDTGEKTGNGIRSCGTTTCSTLPGNERNTMACSLQRIRCSFLTELLGELTSCAGARCYGKKTTKCSTGGDDKHFRLVTQG
ncbi:hypothetical protein Tb09.142.0350 [Trypanosoma brucei brucei TREU927]|uniref:Uncharacterized protein n=1 Tax=Trypanosoma brucei brucei (strain 927/4 GUTat10.1) TaxID=185431 RepID=Q38G38_TRYB2|nr:hypothetical protein Tb09.142.0350 [Trypanosoma brucei brucei TREU927]EAN76232.1 hypothetical protein Tb09.142.0350 [Trypanosoma brucei brucei TREU927]